MHSILALKSTVSVIVNAETQQSEVIYYDLLKTTLTDDSYIGVGTFYWLNSDGNQEVLKSESTELTYSEFNALDGTTPSGTALSSFIAAAKYVQEAVVKSGNFYGLTSSQWVENVH